MPENMIDINKIRIFFGWYALCSMLDCNTEQNLNTTLD